MGAMTCPHDIPLGGLLGGLLQQLKGSSVSGARSGSVSPCDGDLFMGLLRS
jgi:hypothetical protein